MERIKLSIWNKIKGPLQWRALWVTHDKFIAGVSGLILDEKKRVLLLRHAYWSEGSWGFPSGYAKHGEKLEETLAREVREETGYEIEVGNLLKLESGYQLRIEATYLGKLTGGELKIDPKEILEARFFPLDGTPERLLDTHKSIVESYNRPSKERR